MGSVNIRDFPEDLWHALKIRAAVEKKSLRELIIEILQKDMDRYEKRQRGK